MDAIIDYLKPKGQPLFESLLVLIIGWYLAKFIVYLIMKMLARSSADTIILDFVKSILDIIFKILVIVTALSQLGVNTSSLLTILATGGAAIVLGLKDSLSGIASGIIILFTKPFQQGDIIEIKNHVGKIEKIELMYTFLKTFDNKVVIIPNNELVSSTFINYSHEDIRRVDLFFDVHYQSDITIVKQAIKEVIENHPLALSKPDYYIRMSEYKDSSIRIAVRVWCNNEDFFKLKDDLYEQVKVKFDENGIHIPYPQLDVHLDKN